MTLEEKYIIARWAYAIGEEFISDIEYDGIECDLKLRQSLSDYTSKGWSDDQCPYDLLKQFNLDEFIVPAIYSHSTESIESLNTLNTVEDKLRNLNEESRLSYKIDGFSLRLNYYKGKLVLASTRNRNGGKSKNLGLLNKLFKQTIPLQDKVLIVGELYLKNNTIQGYKQLRGIISQRNGVSTAIANGDTEFLGYRCFNIYYNDIEKDNNIVDKYQLLQQLGFPTPKYLKLNNYSKLSKCIEILGAQRRTFDAPTDGLVLENNKLQYALRIGSWEEECNQSYITGYTFNRGMYGNSISADIKPIVLENKTQHKVDITNVQTIIDYNLQIGSPIAFVERSAVNSVIDTTRTLELQQMYINRYDEYRMELDTVNSIKL